ncbi:hypothetical protein SAFG77S_03693 [Streptomyces afghaniensis]
MHQSTTTRGAHHVHAAAARPTTDAALRRSRALRGEFGAPRPVRSRAGAVERAAPGARRADRSVDRCRADHRGRRGAARVDPAAPAAGSGHDLQRAGHRHGDGRDPGPGARRARLGAPREPAGGGDRPERRGDRPVHRGALRPGPARRPDDGASPAHGRLDPPGAHGHRVHGRGDRLRTGRHRGDRHPPLRGGDGPLAQLFLRVFAVPVASGGSAVVATGQPRGAILRP